MEGYLGEPFGSPRWIDGLCVNSGDTVGAVGALWGWEGGGEAREKTCSRTLAGWEMQRTRIMGYKDYRQLYNKVSTGVDRKPAVQKTARTQKDMGVYSAIMPLPYSWPRPPRTSPCLALAVNQCHSESSTSTQPSGMRQVSSSSRGTGTVRTPYSALSCARATGLLRVPSRRPRALIGAAEARRTVYCASPSRERLPRPREVENSELHRQVLACQEAA